MFRHRLAEGRRRRHCGIRWLLRPRPPHASAHDPAAAALQRAQSRAGVSARLPATDGTAYHPSDAGHTRKSGIRQLSDCAQHRPQIYLGADTDNAAYHNHIDFYCRSLICADIINHRLSYYSGKEVTSVDIPAERLQSLCWRAGVVAGVVSALFSLDATPDLLDTPADDIRTRVLESAARPAQAIS